jgi:hypothetical protein
MCGCCVFRGRIIGQLGSFWAEVCGKRRTYIVTRHHHMAFGIELKLVGPPSPLKHTLPTLWHWESSPHTKELPLLLPGIGASSLESENRFKRYSPCSTACSERVACRLPRDCKSVNTVQSAPSVSPPTHSHVAIHAPALVSKKKTMDAYSTVMMSIRKSTETRN